MPPRRFSLIFSYALFFMLTPFSLLIFADILRYSIYAAMPLRCHYAAVIIILPPAAITLLLRCCHVAAAIDYYWGLCPLSFDILQYIGTLFTMIFRYCWYAIARWCHNAIRCRLLMLLIRQFRSFRHCYYYDIIWCCWLPYFSLFIFAYAAILIISRRWYADIFRCHFRCCRCHFSLFAFSCLR